MRKMIPFTLLFLCGVTAGCAGASATPLPAEEPRPAEMADTLLERALMLAHTKCLVGAWRCGAYLSNCKQNALDAESMCAEFNRVCSKILEACTDGSARVFSGNTPL